MLRLSPLGDSPGRLGEPYWVCGGNWLASCKANALSALNVDIFVSRVKSKVSHI